MSKEFGSVIASPMKGFVRSPLGVRETGGVSVVYVDARNTQLSGNVYYFWTFDEKILRVRRDDLSHLVSEARPPWWPDPNPIVGQTWVGDGISGDADTVWYSAFNYVDRYDVHDGRPDQTRYRWKINIYRLNSRLQTVDSWRWHQPRLGGGTAWRIVPFGNSDVLWGLASVTVSPQAGSPIEEMYLVELDPVTMAIRRSSRELWFGLDTAGRARRPYAPSGGGDSSVIWLARTFNFDTAANRQSQIMEYNPSDLRFVRLADGPRSAWEGADKRLIHGIGGNSDTIWLAMQRFPIPGPSTAADFFLSELPSDFSNENRTIIQDEIASPWPFPADIG